MKILAVDDDRVLLEILDHSLRTNGYNDIELLSSPLAAMRQLEDKSRTFDCILLDIEMPEMTGVELCGRIRSLAGYRNTPIIMITSLSDRTSIDQAFKNGASDYVTKPLDKLELHARLRTVKRLVDEQQRLKQLELQVNVQASSSAFEFDFDTPIMVPDFDRGIEFHALQNYLLTLGVKGLYSVAAVAICVENACTSYRTVSRLTFRTMLSDVASVIEDCLKKESLLISYAGRGNFVGILTGRTEWNAVDIELEMNTMMEDFTSIYISDRHQLPKIKVSPIVSNSLFSLTRPSVILDRAIASASNQIGAPSQPYRSGFSLPARAW